MDLHCFMSLGYQWRRHSAEHSFWVSKHKAILGGAIGNWVVSVAHEMPVATICWELVGNTCHYHADNTWKCVDKCQWPRYVEDSLWTRAITTSTPRGNVWTNTTLSPRSWYSVAMWLPRGDHGIVLAGRTCAMCAIGTTRVSYLFLKDVQKCFCRKVGMRLKSWTE